MTLSLVTLAGIALMVALGPSPARAQSVPLAELHVFAGTQADNAGDLKIRAAEAAVWPTIRDRVAIRYDNSLSLDNARLARLGISADAYFISYLHDFNGRFLLSGEVGRRFLPNGQDQTVYKGEGVFFRDNHAAKLGLQVGQTDGALTPSNDTLVYGSYNFPAGQNWRLEPQVYLSESGVNRDREWRLVGYAELNAPKKWQLGMGAGFGEIDSVLPGASGETFNAHARLSWPIKDQRLHFQLQYEASPTSNFTVGQIGVSFRIHRK